jgi:HEAT repeat protein
MIEFAELIRAALVPFLIGTTLVLCAVFVYVLLTHAVREIVFRNRQRLVARYRPLVDALAGFGAADAIARLRRSPRHHRTVIAGLLLAPLRVASGEIVGRLRTAANALGLIDRWKANLSNRRWWVRADAARALGCVHELSALDALIAALDDDHDEVRAAAVEALGMLGDRRGARAIVVRLGDASRLQRARAIDALRRLGPFVKPDLLAYAREHLNEGPDLIEVVGLVSGPAALDDLIVWCSDRRPSIRAAALHALGSIGVDDRSYYYALRGLTDEDADVRARAARALGRSRRPDAAPYLAAHLTDDWQVAAHSAAALRLLGLRGLQALRRHSREPGYTGELVRQMLWEQEAHGAGVSA